MNHLNLITESDFSNFAPEIDMSGYTSATISGMISQASRMVDDYLQFSPFAEDMVDEIRESVVDNNGDLIVRPVKLPIISISSLSVTKGTVTVDLDLQVGGVDKYNIDFRRRFVRYPGAEVTSTGGVLLRDLWSLRGVQFYTKLSYRAGWEPSELPEVIRQAALLFMREVVSVRNNPQGASSISQGAISLTFSGRSDQKSDLVKDAERLLSPYRRIA